MYKLERYRVKYEVTPIVTTSLNGKFEIEGCVCMQFFHSHQEPKRDKEWVTIAERTAEEK